MLTGADPIGSAPVSFWPLRSRLEEITLKHELSDNSLPVGDRAQKLIDFANLYREKLRAAADFLTGVPSAPAAAAEQLALPREVVESIVDRLSRSFLISVKSAL